MNWYRNGLYLVVLTCLFGLLSCERTVPQSWHSKTLGPLSWESHDGLIVADAIHSKLQQEALPATGRHLRFTIDYAFHGELLLAVDLESGKAEILYTIGHVRKQLVLSMEQRQWLRAKLDDMRWGYEPEMYLDGYYAVLEYRHPDGLLIQSDQCPTGTMHALLSYLFRVCDIKDDGYGIRDP